MLLVVFVALVLVVMLVSGEEASLDDMVLVSQPLVTSVGKACFDVSSRSRSSRSFFAPPGNDPWLI